MCETQIERLKNMNWTKKIQDDSKLCKFCILTDLVILVNHQNLWKSQYKIGDKINENSWENR